MRLWLILIFTSITAFAGTVNSPRTGNPFGVSGSFTTNHCLKSADSSGTIVDSGVLCAAAGQAVDALTDHGTVTTTVAIDFTTSNYHRFKMTAATDVTVSFTDPADPMMVYVDVVGAGSGALKSITWPDTVTNSGADVPSSLGYANDENVFLFFWDGGQYHYQTSWHDFTANPLLSPEFKGYIRVGPSPVTNINGYVELEIGVDNAANTAYLAVSDNTASSLGNAITIDRTATTGGGLILGAATGGGKGLGTINVVTYYVNGAALAASNLAGNIKTAWLGTTSTTAAAGNDVRITGAAQLQGTGVTGSISGALTLGVCNTGTAAVTGATTAMAVIATPTTYPGDGVVWMGYVSATGTVTVKECGLGALSPTASTYQVRVLQ